MQPGLCPRESAPNVFYLRMMNFTIIQKFIPRKSKPRAALTTFISPKGKGSTAYIVYTA